MGTKITLLSVYLGGNLPEYFPLTKKSAQFNKNYTWRIFTDSVTEPVIEENVHLIPYSLDALNQGLSKLLGEPITITTPYKIADTKVFWGALFQNHIKTPWYGFTDLDCVYGDFDFFLTDDLFENYDVITQFTSNPKQLHGPLSFFRNTPEIVDLYKSIKNIVELTNTINGTRIIYAIEEGLLHPVLEEKNLRVFAGTSDKKFLIRYGNRRLPSIWKNGKVYVESLLKDYGNIDPETEGHTLFLHIRKEYAVNVETGDIQAKFEAEFLERKGDETKILTITRAGTMNNDYALLTGYIPMIWYLEQKYGIDTVSINNPPLNKKLEKVLQLFGCKSKITNHKKGTSATERYLQPNEIPKGFFSSQNIPKKMGLPQKILLIEREIPQPLLKKILANGFFPINNSMEPEVLAEAFAHAKIVITSSTPSLGYLILKNPKLTCIHLFETEPAKNLQPLFKKIPHKPTFHQLKNELESLQELTKLLEAIKK